MKRARPSTDLDLVYPFDAKFPIIVPPFIDPDGGIGPVPPDGNLGLKTKYPIFVNTKNEIDLKYGQGLTVQNNALTLATPLPITTTEPLSITTTSKKTTINFNYDEAAFLITNKKFSIKLAVDGGLEINQGLRLKLPLPISVTPPLKITSGNQTQLSILLDPNTFELNNDTLTLKLLQNGGLAKNNGLQLIKPLPITATSPLQISNLTGNSNILLNIGNSLQTVTGALNVKLADSSLSSTITGLKVQLKVNGGLQTTATGLEVIPNSIIKIDPAGGLENNPTTGLKLKVPLPLTATPPLQMSNNQISLQLTPPLSTSANSLTLNINNSLEINANNLQVKLKPQGGIQLETSGLSVIPNANIQLDPNGGLQTSQAGLGIKVGLGLRISNGNQTLEINPGTGLQFNSNNSLGLKVQNPIKLDNSAGLTFNYNRSCALDRTAAGLLIMLKNGLTFERWAGDNNQNGISINLGNGLEFGPETTASFAGAPKLRAIKVKLGKGLTYTPVSGSTGPKQLQVHPGNGLTFAPSPSGGSGDIPATHAIQVNIGSGLRIDPQGRLEINPPLHILWSSTQLNARLLGITETVPSPLNPNCYFQLKLIKQAGITHGLVSFRTTTVPFYSNMMIKLIFDTNGALVSTSSLATNQWGSFNPANLVPSATDPPGFPPRKSFLPNRHFYGDNALVSSSMYSAAIFQTPTNTPSDPKFPKEFTNRIKFLVKFNAQDTSTSNPYSLTFLWGDLRNIDRGDSFVTSVCQFSYINEDVQFNSP
ncbi:fiber [Bottlenose dolphin adenovirus 1]|uniref:Fiber n=1 Tax=Bottlenose dolphin adenovirus 1 TaxID=1714377 RepID=A0A1X7MPK1_9ADEN|nr:fiber [Bottlenose dolphin adenovirus 1]SMG83459.1 fiber [Bottlenose dolphin adenovirus 1]